MQMRHTDDSAAGYEDVAESGAGTGKLSLLVGVCCGGSKRRQELWLLEGHGRGG